MMDVWQRNYGLMLQLMDIIRLLDACNRCVGGVFQYLRGVTNCLELLLAGDSLNENGEISCLQKHGLITSFHY